MRIPVWCSIIIHLCLRHILFPLILALFMLAFGFDNQAIKLSVAVADTSTGLQAFAISNTRNFYVMTCGMMILLGMFVQIATIPLWNIVVDKLVPP